MFRVLTIVTGTGGSGKTRRVYEMFRERMRLGGTELVLLTPEQQTHRAERELSAVCGPSLSLHGEVLSFTRLYDRAAAELGGIADRVPDKSGRLLLLAGALNEAAPLLRHYGVRRRADFLPQLMQTVEELENSMTEPEALLRAAEAAEGTIADKLYDIALLRDAYRAALTARLGDPRDRLTRLAALMPKCSAGRGGIYIDGFTDFTAVEWEIIDGILRRGTELTVALTLGDEENDSFRLTEETSARLIRLAAERNTELRFERCEREPNPIRLLADSLGRFGAEKEKLPETESVPVELQRMNRPAGECRFAAMRILELLRADETLRFRDFAVAVSDFEGYRVLLETVFREYGIPFFVEETESLGRTGLASFLLDALRCVCGGWRYAELFSCLKSGLAGLSAGDCDLLESYCLMWNLRGESVWRQEKPWDRNPRGYAEELTPEDAALLEKLDELRRRAAEPFLALSEKLRAAELGGERLAALIAFLKDIRLSETLAERAERLEERGEKQAANAVRSRWEELLEALSQFGDALGGVNLSDDEFIRMLELLLNSRSIGSIPATLDSVSVGGLSRLRGRRPRVLILLGADDASLPGSGESGGIFSEAERRTLFDLGIRLDGQRDEAAARRMYDFYQIAAAPEERLILCLSGEDKRPSRLQVKAEELFGLAEHSEEELDGRHLCAAKVPAFRYALAGHGARAEAAAKCQDPAELETVRSAVRRERGSLSPRRSRELYGSTIRLSATRAENFFKCRCRYFMQYGLRAREWREAGFQAPELGTFIHFVLEGVCREVAELGGFRVLTAEKRKELAEKYTGEYISRYLRPGQLEEPRFRYLFDRTRKSVDAILKDISEELAASDFLPLDFELSFGSEDGDLPAVEQDGISVSGKIDRVDGWLDGDTLYLCVADYKTGQTAFSLSDVRYGLGMQMLFYLFALAEKGETRYGKKIVPAGVLYAPAKDLLLRMPRGSSDEEIAAKRRETLRRTGLLLADERVLKARENSEKTRFIPVKYKDGAAQGSLATAAQLGALANYIRTLLDKLGRALKQGSVCANPVYRSESDNGCSYCPYADACGFEDGARGESFTVIRKLKDEEAFAAMGAGPDDPE